MFILLVVVVGGDADSMKLCVNTIIRKPCKTESCVKTERRTSNKQRRSKVVALSVELMCVARYAKRKKKEEG